MKHFSLHCDGIMKLKVKERRGRENKERFIGLSVVIEQGTALAGGVNPCLPQ